MASKYPLSEDQNDLTLCPVDQKNPGSCHHPRSCDYLHMCCDYLLNSKCSQFELHGKCTHSHSFYTMHNQRVLAKKYRLKANDEDIFERVSKIIRTSTSEETLSRFHQSSISNDDRDVGLTCEQPSTSSFGHTHSITSGHGHTRLSLQRSVPAPSFSNETSSSLSNNQSSTQKKPYHISTRLGRSGNPSSSTQGKSKSTDILSHSKSGMTIRSIDLDPDQRLTSEGLPPTRRSLSVFGKDRKEKFTNNDQSSSSDDIDKRPGTSHSATGISSIKNSVVSFVLRDYRTKKPKDSSMPDPNVSIISGTEMKYIFNKHVNHDQLCYLFGPGIRRLIQHEGYQILPSGYCQLKNLNELKQIEAKFDTLLPVRVRVDRVQLPKDDLALIISTSMAERFFEQNQIDYAIISEPYPVSFDIEVIHPPKSDPTRSSSNNLSSTLSIGKEKSSPSPSDGKFHITSTNSSIDVICEDITRVQVDLLVCVTTSMTLLNSVLDQAGTSISRQYAKQSRSNNALLLDGGSTSAQKILFIAWELEVQSSDTLKAQNSLSKLVKDCIEYANQSKMRSIAFPSIGTGKIGLDTYKVCESMIGAASERLHQYKMDVLFVIHPSSGSKPKEQTYQIFRMYLNDLCKQIKSTRADPSSVIPGAQSSTIAVERTQRIPRTLTCKRILTVSDSLNVPPHHLLLVRSLEKLIEEKTYDLSLVQQLFTDRVQLLIDVCLNYHVLPCIDLSKGKLKLRGDRDSCAQCFANLLKQKLIHKYTISLTIGKKLEDITMNTYVSMKIDEALMNGDSEIVIEDDDRTVFDIDLKNLRVYVNSNKRPDTLYTAQLNADSKIVPPKTWSSSALQIRTVEVPHSSFGSMEWVRIFEQTMPKSKWPIERIDAIENWPLYVHFARKQKTKYDTFVFHGCPFSSVQSIIHYGLHSKSDNRICLTRDALNSHIHGTRRSTDGKYYIFVILLSKKISDQDFIYLSNTEAHLALPAHLIVYRQ